MGKKRTRCAGLIALLVAMMLVGAGSAFGLATTWVGGDVGNETKWETAANWSAGVPGAGDDAIIPFVPNMPTVPAAGGTCLNLQIDTTGGVVTVTLAGNLTIPTGGSVSVTAGGNAATVTGAGDIVLGGTATINNSTASLLTISCANINGNGANLITFTGGENIAVNAAIVDGAATPVTINMTASSDVVTFSGNNTYTGTTTITTGNLTTGGAGKIADTSPVTLAANGILTLGGAEKIYTLTGAAGSQINNGGNLLTIDQHAATAFDGVISGAGGLTLDAASTSILSLGGANTYTGTTTINANGITTTAAGVIADTSPVTLAAAGRLVLGGAEKIYTLTGAAGSQINNGGNLLTIDQHAATAFAGVISGAGGLTLDAASTNTLTLSGVNTYTGPTTVNAATLSFDAINTGVSAVTANNAGTKVAGSGTIPGTLTMNTGTILAPGAAGGAGTGTLTVNGAITLNGTSKYEITMIGGNIDKIVAGAALTATGSTPTMEFQAGYNSSGLALPATIMDITGAYTAFTNGLPVGYVVDGAKVGNLIRITAVPAAVPTLNEWGMIVMMLLLAGASIVLIRRRRVGFSM